MADPAATSPQSLDEFLRVVRASGVVESNALDELVAPWNGTSGPMPEECVRAILDRGLLTPWQMEQLRKGRHKGLVLDKYRLLRLLGAGGMGSVYLAEHMVLGSKVAIKVLPAKRVDTTSYLERFKREAKASARLNHPHIARATDFGTLVDGALTIYFIVMEYIEGIDLHTRVKQEGPLSVREAADFIRQAADGLQHAHDEGFVHRDIKPHNLMVDKRGHVKILDMGLALVQDDDEEASLTKAHDEKVLGTADYLAPEQARDCHKADTRSDIYSLGCTLYYLLVGRAPFAKGKIVERIRSQLNEPAPNLLDARPDVPPAIVELYFRMMEKNPDARQQSAQEVADALEHWLEATAPSAVRQRPQPPRREAIRRTSDTSTGPRPDHDPRFSMDTPPPSSGSLSTGRLPSVSPRLHSQTVPARSFAGGGVAIDTRPVSGKGSDGDGGRMAGATTKVSPWTKIVPVAREWLLRRIRGLPLVAWIVGGLFLALTLAGLGWAWLGGFVTGETAPIQKPPAVERQSRKLEQVKKTTQRRPPRKEKSSEPSPLDNLEPPPQ